MKKFLRNKLPSPDLLTKNRYLKFLQPWLSHPRLWHMNRRSVALGAAIGVITGLIPGPVQILLALLIVIPLRGNVLVAAFATFYTNPFTFIPLYMLAYKIGGWVTGQETKMVIPHNIEWSLSNLHNVIPEMIHWLLSLGDTLLIGLVIEGVIFSLITYVTIMLTWRIMVARQWQKRHIARRS